MIYTTDRLEPEERTVTQNVLSSQTYADGTQRSTRRPRRMPTRTQPNQYRAVLGKPAPGCTSGGTRRRYIDPMTALIKAREATAHLNTEETRNAV